MMTNSPTASDLLALLDARPEILDRILHDVLIAPDVDPEAEEGERWDNAQ